VDPLLADAEAALADPGSAAAPAEDRAGLRMACARTLYVEGRTEEAARQLEAARALLTAPAGSRGTARLLGEALAGLASIRLLLDAPDAAEEAARAALEALEGAVDDPWDETAWHAAVVLVRILRARGATEEAERLMTAHEVTEDELEAWTGWED
jgi:hypothetical protein